MVAALAATILLFGGLLGGEEAAPALLGSFEQAPSTPTDGPSLVSLGLAYQQRARETADASYLTRSETALRRALRLDSRNAAATEGLAALALTRHDFRGALALAQRARRLAPDSTRPLALVGDALVELGRYPAAFAAFDALALRKPGLNAYARVAYGRELIGDRAGATEAMRLAVAAAPGRSEPTAWVHVELAKLSFGGGDLAAARREYHAALAAFPGYVYALDGLAHVEAANGRLNDAIALAREAAERAPLPQFVITLGDLYRAAGREADAAEQYDLLAGIRRLVEANGVRTDLELALFDVDHGLRLRAALEDARRAHPLRPSIHADDVLAWALARNGRCVEALRWSKRSLRLGTRDAALFFHRGVIERCLGRRETARSWFRRALSLNPHFSLVWAPVAKRYAR
jgi:tetratricopeptide (TPR) repeat protein